MKIKLPNGTDFELNDNLDINGKLKEVERLVNEWQSEITSNWNGNNVKYFIDSLSNYLVWHKEDREIGKRGKEDKDVLSKKKTEKLVRYKKTSKEINFSDLNKEQRYLLFGEEIRGNKNE